MEIIKKCICAGYFINGSKIKTAGEYFNLRTGLTGKIHPSSSLFQLGYIPDYIVYNEIILTSKEYIHMATAVEAQWLAEFGHMFFKIKEK